MLTLFKLHCSLGFCALRTLPLSWPPPHALMAPAKKRNLRATPSCPEEVHPLSVALCQRLDHEYLGVIEHKDTFRAIVHRYAQEHAKPGEMQARVAKVMAMVNATYDPSLWSVAPAFGHCTTAIMQWSFTEESMWRGTPKNKIVLKYAKSMTAVGFRKDGHMAQATRDRPNA